MKKLKFVLRHTLFAVIIGIFIGFVKVDAAHAFDLIEFIARPEFSAHTLSTGEFIRYTSEGGGSTLGDPVRQYKNGNWEQFYLGTFWIYRREDTSWQVGGVDPLCENGNRAIYTQDTGPCNYSPGSVPATDGAGWAPARGSSVNQVWSSQAHNIVPIDSGVGPGVYSGYPISDRSSLRMCNLSNANQVGNYPACGPDGNGIVNTAVITGYYEPGQYTFCSGITNPAPVVTISGTGGAGAGEGFAYMKGCGLVGFTDDNMRTGIVSGCGVDASSVDTSGCTNVGAFDSTGVPRTISGRVMSDKPITETVLGKSVEITNAPVTGATVCAYGGTYDTDVGKRGGMIPNFEGSGISDRNGEFTLNTSWRTSGPRASFEDSNYVAVYCGPNLVDVYKVGLACGDVELPAFTINCDRYSNPLTSCPPFLPYADRNGYMMCAHQGPQKGLSAMLGEVAPKIWIQFRTPQHIGDDPATVPERDTMEATTEGRFSLTNFLADLKYKIAAPAITVGGPKDYYITPKEGQPRNLPSCELVNASGSNEIGVLRTGNANDAIRWSVAVTLATPSFENDSTIPGDIKRLVESTNPETIVCRNSAGQDVQLAEFKPPYLESCDGYTYCDSYPYYALYGDSTGQFQTLKSKTANDPMENEGDGARAEFTFTEDSGWSPYVGDATVRYPFSKVASLTTSNIQTENPVPSFVADTPWTTRGADESVTLNGSPAELRLNQVEYRSCQVWRMGVQQALCTCSDMDGDCSDPQNTFSNADEADAYVSGWEYCDEADGDCSDFYGNQIGGLAGFFANLWQSILAWFNPGPECREERQLLGCTSPIEGISHEYCVEQCHSDTPTIPVECTWAPPEYICDGEWDHRLLGNIRRSTMEDTRDAEVSAGLAEFALTLSPPCDENDPECMETMDLCGADARTTSEKNPGDLEGLGADFPCVSSSGTSPKQLADLIRRSVRDPVTKSENDPGAPVPPGGTTPPSPPGDGGGIVTGRCAPLTSGPCSVENLSRYFPTPESATIASRICNRESGGNPRALNNSCLVGGSYDYSAGLFQINLVSGANGAGRCAWAGHPGTYASGLPGGVCTPVPNQAALDACVGAFWEPDRNITFARMLANCDAAGNCNWGAWSAARACGIIN